MNEKRKELPRSKLESVREACLLVGFLMVGVGVWLIYPPASYIVCGLGLLWVGWPAKQPTIQPPQQRRRE